MKITTLFLDIGGVLLTDGWSQKFRKLAAKRFNLDFKEMEQRHKMIFDTYELGKINLKEYLHRAIFNEKRSFTPAQFREFMFAQSQPYPAMIEMICQLKKQYGLKIAVVSNEAYELNAYRIKKFKLNSFVDFFISSCYVHLRKPDPEIYRMALDIAQTPIDQVLYIENMPMFIAVAKDLGIKGIYHTDYQSTCDQLSGFGLTAPRPHF